MTWTRVAGIAYLAAVAGVFLYFTWPFGLLLPGLIGLVVTIALALHAATGGRYY